MRIVGGKFKGRQLRAPANLPVRPTTNFAKESIFNIIQHNFDFEELHVLDLFCGTGNVSIEFVSRGVASVVSVDQHHDCTRFVYKTAESLNIDNLQVKKSDVQRYLKATKELFSIIFADPPFEMDHVDSIPDLVFSQQVLKEGGWLILEHAPKKDFSKHPNFVEHRKYGHVNFSIFSH